MSAATDAARALCKRVRCMEANYAAGLCKRHTEDPGYVVPTPRALELAAAREAQRAAKVRDKLAREQERAIKRRGMLCKTGDCNLKSYALGMCRSHYGRYKRYGDALATTRPGGPKYTPTVLEDAGVTLRQLQHWHRQGYLRAPLDPSGNRRAWNAIEVRVALVMHRLVGAGFTVETAAKLARGLVDGGVGRVRLAPRVTLTLEEGPEARTVSPW